MGRWRMWRFSARAATAIRAVLLSFKPPASLQNSVPSAPLWLPVTLRLTALVSTVSPSSVSLRVARCSVRIRQLEPVLTDRVTRRLTVRKYRPPRVGTRDEAVASATAR